MLKNTTFDIIESPSQINDTLKSRFLKCESNAINLCDFYLILDFLVVIPKSISILYESMDVLIMTVEKSLFTRISKKKEESIEDKSIVSSFLSLLHMTFLLPFSDQLPYFRNKNV